MRATATDPRRSAIMRAIGSKDTTPELIVRGLAHRLGFRYRLHRPDLPGRPDLTFAGRWKIVFVNGCFWHGHSCTRGAREPKTNADYWRAKIQRNQSRDAKNLELLRCAGWRILIIWECETAKRKQAGLEQTLREFLG